MSYDHHDIAVMNRINRHILKVNSELKKETVTRKLDQAWSNNIAERDKDSTNIIGRDSDYYLAARHTMATTDSSIIKAGMAVLGQAAYVRYNAEKLYNIAKGTPEKSRTNPDSPNAPIGGYVWMNRGVADSFSDVGAIVDSAKLHKQ